MSEHLTPERLANTRAWAAARPDMSGSGVIIGAIDELIAARSRIAELERESAIRTAQHQEHIARQERYLRAIQECRQLREQLTQAEQTITRLDEICKQAHAMLNAIDARHDQPPPLKYTIPYGAVNGLRAALTQQRQEQSK